MQNATPKCGDTITVCWSTPQARKSGKMQAHAEVRSHALRALTIVIYDRRSFKVLTIYDPRYRENASTTYDLRSLPFLTIRDLRSMTFQLTIDDLSPFLRFTIYGSRGSIRGLRSTIDDLFIFKEQTKCSSFRKQLNDIGVAKPHK